MAEDRSTRDRSGGDDFDDKKDKLDSSHNR